MVVILVGPPGSGKSTFCEEVMRLSTRQWVRICQVLFYNTTLDGFNLFDEMPLMGCCVSPC